MIEEIIGRPHLTPREIQILELVANGYSAKKAAVILKIAPRTVERHTENLRLKMRARNRAHMIALAVLSGDLKLDAQPHEETDGARNACPSPH